VNIGRRARPVGNAFGGNIVKKLSVTAIAVCATLLCTGAAQAARFETHSTNPAVPEGTVYDTSTNLLWEKKTPSGTGGVHDVDNRYSWTVSQSGSAPNGDAFTEFLGALNDARSYNGKTVSGCFANHCDWRLPQIDELSGIFDSSAAGCRSGDPCIDSTFGPTQSLNYWSATTTLGSGGYAWFVDFSTGSISNDFKTSEAYGRAVRSGL
jgi:hypothetical protein